MKAHERNINLYYHEKPEDPKRNSYSFNQREGGKNYKTPELSKRILSTFGGTIEADSPDYMLLHDSYI